MNETAFQTCVVGDWMLDQPDAEPYPAEIASRWNGWAVPTVDRATLERIVADQNALVAGIDETAMAAASTLSIEGDAVRFTYPDLDVDQAIDPDPDGRYTLDLGWCWDSIDTQAELDDWQNARIR